MTIKWDRSIMNDLTSLAGPSGAGKSHFGRWLEANTDALHIDVERDGRLETMGLRSSWDHLLLTQDPARFVLSLRELRRPVGFKWGFPPHMLPVVSLLKMGGFSLWWFGGDLEGARRAFNRCGDVSSKLFDVQVAAIAAAWSAIEQVFAPNLLDVVDSGGNHLPAEQIHALLIDGLPPSA